MSARLTGHGLVAGGRVWIPGQPVRNGAGKGVCGCGTESPVLPSTRQRQQWHHGHKADRTAGSAGQDATTTAPYRDGE